MHSECRQAERNFAVRKAAGQWQKAGLISPEILDAIRSSYTDDRRRLGFVFRTLAFLCAFLASLALVLLLWRLGGGDLELLSLLGGISLLLFTRYLKEKRRLADFGIESATAILGCALLSIGIALLIDFSRSFHIILNLCLGSFIFLVPAVLWGSIFCTVVSLLLFGFAMLSLPMPRLVWALISLTLLVLALRRHQSPGLAPSHRRCWTAALLLALLGLYVVTNLLSWDHLFLEHSAFFRTSPAGDSWIKEMRWIPILSTAAMPLLLIAWGILARRKLLLQSGLLLLVASLVTLRFYVHVAPLWVVLTASGALLILTGLGLKRFLDSGPDQERGGFTARPILAEGRKEEAMQALAGIFSGSPPAEAHHGERFTGGGGHSGGAGASGQF